MFVSPGAGIPAAIAPFGEAAGFSFGSAAPTPHSSRPVRRVHRRPASGQDDTPARVLCRPLRAPQQRSRAASARTSLAAVIERARPGTQSWRVGRGSAKGSGQIRSQGAVSGHGRSCWHVPARDGVDGCERAILRPRSLARRFLISVFDVPSVAHLPLDRSNKAKGMSVHAHGCLPHR
jgi:hypothetical protein